MNDLIPALGRATKYAGQFAVVDGELVFQGLDDSRRDWSPEAGVKVIIVGEPTVTIVPPLETVVKAGTNVVYTIKFTSNAALTTISLTDKVEVLDDSNVALPTQPIITIGAVSGTVADATRQVDITIKTNSLANGAYKLKIKAGSVTNVNNMSNTQDTISPIGFDIDNTAPENPIMSANPTDWTNGNVAVTITYSSDAVIKEYSLDGVNWNIYTSPVVVTTNNITVYARGKDSAGNESGHSTLSVANIDKVLPTVTFSSDGNSIASGSASSIVTVADTVGSNIDITSLQYIWSTSITEPTSEWINFTYNVVGTNITTPNGLDGLYYLWIKAKDNAGNITVAKTTQTFNLEIDTTPPNILLSEQSEWESTIIEVTATITDTSGIALQKWSAGTQTAAYFTSGGTSFIGNIFNVNANGIYTVYAKDTVGNETVQTITITKIDNVLPTLSSVLINNGDTYATEYVTISIVASDTQGGLSQMCFSNDNVTWSSWENFATNKTGWSLTNGYGGNTNVGIKRVYVKVKDNVGNISTVRNDAIEYYPQPLFTGSFRYDMSVGQTVYMLVTGKNGQYDGTVYGTDIYALGSAIGKTAVHAGKVSVGETKVLTIRKISPATSSGSTRNGVTSLNCSLDANADGLGGAYIFL